MRPHSWNLSKRALWPLALLLTCLTGCSFEGDPLEDRRCINNEACWERFGQEFFCRQQSGDQGGYCQELGAIKCDRVEANWEVMGDAACDDNIFCNGDEVCDSANPDADDFGCVTMPRVLDDGIECTVDYCDEVNRVVLHDEFANCQCPSQNGDRHCQTLFAGPCVTAATCNPQTLQCDVQYIPAGEACEDGVACTTGSTCDDAHACVGGAPDHDACDDDQVCTGRELCAPGDAQADSRGCVPGAPVISDPDQDDGIACTRTSCEGNGQGAISHVPTSQCACLTPDDCRAADPAMACAVFRCDASTGYTCVPDDGGATLADGAPCDDQVRCTANDTCQQGACVGTPTHLFCDPNGAGLCDPSNNGADNDGCVLGR
jgi:hypothetical protein